MAIRKKKKEGKAMKKENANQTDALLLSVINGMERRTRKTEAIEMIPRILNQSRNGWALGELISMIKSKASRF
ncbi:MAG: hypothetical protein D6732_24875 [Methanobacteriota archaeon]|nr:MAG: hypothetical protein D6732_24875 [Euryarchaeota archaeon]